MFITVRELELHGVAFDESVPPGRIDFGGEVVQVQKLVIRGSAELMAAEIRMRGLFRTAVEVPCARCLEPTRRELQMDFDLFYRPIATIAKNEEIEITADDLDVGFYHGDGLLLEDVIKEQILLALPMKNVCRPDCSGLCPRCGQNQNLADCGCKPPSGDLRWTPLAKFKE